MRSEVPSDRNPLLFRDLLNGFFTVSRYEVLCGLVKGTVPLFLLDASMPDLPTEVLDDEQKDSVPLLF